MQPAPDPRSLMDGVSQANKYTDWALLAGIMCARR